MQNPPFMMTRQNIEQGLTPNNINLSRNWLGQYFARFLLQKIMGVFKVKLPKANEVTFRDWAFNYFWYCLFQFGYFVVLRTRKFGVIMQQCNPGGFDINYNPYYVTVTNPLLGLDTPVRLEIDRDCVVVQLTPDWAGISDLINYYAGLLALVGQTTTINLFNSRLSYVFAVKDRNSAEAMKLLAENISKGQIANVIDKKLLGDNGEPTWQLFEQDVGGNYIVDKLLDAWATIENKFATDVGLPNANTSKRERLITDEVNANNVTTAAMAGMWLENMKRGFDKANKMFGLDMSIEWKYNPLQDSRGEEAGDDRRDNNPKGDSSRTA